MNPARFIVFEGLDGAGSTTQALRAAQALRTSGASVTETREPSEGPIGTLIRQALRRRLLLPDGEPLDPRSLALLFAADRIDHLRAVVEPALTAGRHVVSDRYVHSSLAYQGAELPMPWVASINAQARRADVVVFIDTPVVLCVQRIAARGAAPELYETRERLDAVRQRYDEAFALRDEPVLIVDGAGTIDEVHGRVMAALRDRGLATP